MKKLLLLLYIVISQALVVPVFAQEKYRSESLYQELDELAAKNGIPYMQNFLNEHAKNLKERWVILQWLKDKVWEQRNPDPFYSLVYSDMLFTTAKYFDQSGDKKVANELYPSSYRMLKVFELMAFTDAARCKDVTVVGSVSKLLANRFAALSTAKDRISAKDKEISQKSALDYEEILVNRRPFSAICKSGLAAIRATLADPNHKEHAGHDPNQIGSQIVISSDKEFVPELLTDEEWGKKRAETRARFQEGNLSPGF